MARNVYGLDLGTYEIKVYDKKKDEIWKEKNVLAIADEKNIIAVGDDAFEMFEKAPGNIEVVFPMKEGVIGRFHDMQYLLQSLLNKDKKFVRGSEYVIAVPTDVTEVEKRAFFDLVIHSQAKAREVNIVERAIAQCVGLGIDIQNTKGVLIADFGGETTEFSIVASGGMVLNKMLKIGGNTLDYAICNLIRHNYDFLIGRLTAESLRCQFGLIGAGTESKIRVAGRNLITGVPQQMDISNSSVRAAMKDSLAECTMNINLLLERTPPEVLNAIKDNGIYLTGGLAHLSGLSQYIEGATGYKVHVAPHPDTCTVEGLSRIIMSKELKKLAYSMMDSNYRWMR